MYNIHVSGFFFFFLNFHLKLCLNIHLHLADLFQFNNYCILSQQTLRFILFVYKHFFLYYELRKYN